MEKKRKVLNNNGIGVLLLINAILLLATLLTNCSDKDIEAREQVVYASEINSTLENEDKRKSSDNDDDNETNEVETFSITYSLESVAHFSENIEGTPMYFSHVNEKGAYFTYAMTDKPKAWNNGYWFVSHKVMEQGYYDVTLLDHNDELRSIFIADETGNGLDYMQLKPANDLEKGYAFNQ